jgi:hypothetical protein
MLWIIWLAAVLLLTLFWIFRRWIFNFHYFLAVVIDAFNDFFCQCWIDLEKLWKRRKKKPEIDDTSDFYHLD